MALTWINQSGDPKLNFVAPGIAEVDINYNSDDAYDYALNTKGLGTGTLKIYAVAGYDAKISVHTAKRPVPAQMSANYDANEWFQVVEYDESILSAGIDEAIEITVPEQAILVRFEAGVDTKERGALFSFALDRRYRPGQATA